MMCMCSLFSNVMCVFVFSNDAYVFSNIVCSVMICVCVRACVCVQ